MSQILSTMSSISTARIIDINNTISSYSTLQGPIVTLNNFSSVLSSQNYVSKLNTGVINTSTLQQQGVKQPFIQYGSNILTESGNNQLTLSTIYKNTNYTIQLTYFALSNTYTLPLYSSNATTSNFAVYGDSNASFYWTTFGDLF